MAVRAETGRNSAGSIRRCGDGQADQREHSAAVSLHAACGSYEHGDNRTGLLSGAFSGGDCLSAVSSAAREKQPNAGKCGAQSAGCKSEKPGLYY